MKGTNHFKLTILNYLEQRANTDSLFAENYRKPEKNIDDCITYILNSVKQSGCNGFSDEEIFGMAVHYYDEDNIDIGKPINANIVVNHVVELTEEEREQARKDAIQRVHDEAYARMKQTNKPKKVEQATQASLFDF